MILKGTFTFVSSMARHFDATEDKPGRDTTMVNVLDENNRIMSFYTAEPVPELVMGDFVDLTFNVYMGRDRAYHVSLKNITNAV